MILHNLTPSTQAAGQRTRVRSNPAAAPDWTDSDEAMAWCESLLDDRYERVNAALDLEAAALNRLGKQEPEASAPSADDAQVLPQLMCIFVHGC